MSDPPRLPPMDAGLEVALWTDMIVIGNPYDAATSLLRRPSMLQLVKQALTTRPLATGAEKAFVTRFHDLLKRSMPPVNVLVKIVGPRLEPMAMCRQIVSSSIRTALNTLGDHTVEDVWVIYHSGPKGATGAHYDVVVSDEHGEIFAPEVVAFFRDKAKEAGDKGLAEFRKLTKS